MDFDVLASMAGGLAPYGLLAFLGLIFAVLAGVLAITGRPVHPVAGAAGVALAAVGSAATAWWALPGDPTAAGAIDGMKLACVTRFAAWFGMGLVGILGLATLAFAGARGQPRDTRAAMIMGGAGFVVAALTGAGGVAVAPDGPTVFFYARALEYALFALLLAGASLAGGPKEGPGRGAAAAAAVSFGLAVAVGESASRAVTWFILLISAGTVEVSQRPTVIRGYLELTGGEVAWLVAITVAGALVSVLGVALAAREGDKTAWASLVWLLLVPVVWFAGTPSVEALEAAAALLP